MKPRPKFIENPPLDRRRSQFMVSLSLPPGADDRRAKAFIYESIILRLGSPASMAKDDPMVNLEKASVWVAKV